MHVQDKAALLATMQPEAVAQLLACMDPHEAVLLLAALGDGSTALVSSFLSGEDRDRLVQVLQAADCKPRASAAKARGGAAVRHSGRRLGHAYAGSFRKGAAQDTVERLVDAYQVRVPTARTRGPASPLAQTGCLALRRALRRAATP